VAGITDSNNVILNTNTYTDCDADGTSGFIYKYDSDYSTILFRRIIMAPSSDNEVTDIISLQMSYYNAGASAISSDTYVTD
jgi:hypothetical protein